MNNDIETLPNGDFKVKKPSTQEQTLLKECGITAVYLSKKLGIPEKTMSAYIYGARTPPEHLIKKLKYIKKAHDRILK